MMMLIKLWVFVGEKRWRKEARKTRQAWNTLWVDMGVRLYRFSIYILSLYRLHPPPSSKQFEQNVLLCWYPMICESYLITQRLKSDNIISYAERFKLKSFPPFMYQFSVSMCLIHDWDVVYMLGYGDRHHLGNGTAKLSSLSLARGEICQPFSIDWKWVFSEMWNFN